MIPQRVNSDTESNHALHPTLTWGAVTHVGGVRQHNEDAFFVSPNVCVVADGMGGHQAGEVASQLVTSMVAAEFADRRLGVTELPRLVTTLNDAVLATGHQNDTRGMGTTLVGVARADNGGTESAVVFHVGDSRCYRLADGTMTQITTDHSHVQELLDQGRITASEVRTHPLRNMITRALGAESTVRADFHVLPDTDCRLLLCSDGLSGELDDERIHELLRGSEHPTDAAGSLLDAAISGTASDNVTVIVVDLRFVGADEVSVAAGDGVLDDDSSDEITTDLAVVTAPIETTADPAVETAVETTPGDDDGADQVDENVDDNVAVGRPSTAPDGAAWDETNPS